MDHLKLLVDRGKKKKSKLTLSLFYCFLIIPLDNAPVTACTPSLRGSLCCVRLLQSLLTGSWPVGRKYSFSHCFFLPLCNVLSGYDRVPAAFVDHEGNLDES